MAWQRRCSVAPQAGRTQTRPSKSDEGASSAPLQARMDGSASGATVSRRASSDSVAAATLYATVRRGAAFAVAPFFGGGSAGGSVGMPAARGVAGGSEPAAARAGAARRGAGRARGVAKKRAEGTAAARLGSAACANARARAPAAPARASAGAHAAACAGASATRGMEARSVKSRYVRRCGGDTRVGGSGARSKAVQRHVSVRATPSGASLLRCRRTGAAGGPAQRRALLPALWPRGLARCTS